MSLVAPSLEWAQPLVRDWFVQRFSTPTEPQEQGWPHILAGRTTLISAPTGAGSEDQAEAPGSHAYAQPGLYHARVALRDPASGKIATAGVMVRIAGPSGPSPSVSPQSFSVSNSLLVRNATVATFQDPGGPTDPAKAHGILVWRLEGGTGLESFQGPEVAPESMAFAPDGRRLYTGNGNGSCYELDVPGLLADGV